MHSAPVTRKSILIVADEKMVRESLQWTLRDDYQLHIAANARQALTRLQQNHIDLVFQDALLPDMNGIDLLKQLKRMVPAVRVILLTAIRDIKTAVAAMKAGAFDCLPKPFHGDQIRALVKRGLMRRNTGFGIQPDQALEDRRGQDRAMASVYRIIDCVSPCESHVLIQGANGTGKKRIARRLHNHSTRSASPYVTVNCAAIPAPQMEPILFGPGRGSFNGMSHHGPGKIELARGGSIFINNINYLSINVQTQLLDFIRHKAFEQPGTQRKIKADVRIIAATNQNLKALVDAHLFRKDLHNRLSELPIDLPLLRQRGDDIGLLLEHYLKQMALQNGNPPRHFSPQARSTLLTGDWPSNVREFEHLVERLCALDEGRPLSAADLPRHQPPVQPTPAGHLKLKHATRAFERQYIKDTLRAVDGSKTKAARRLGIHRNTLLSKTKALGIAIQ